MSKLDIKKIEDNLKQAREQLEASRERLLKMVDRIKSV